MAQRLGFARNVGRKLALEKALTGDAIDAATAAEWGLINQAVAPEQLEAATPESDPARDPGQRPVQGAGQTGLLPAN